jgi:hypothetical protein
VHQPFITALVALILISASAHATQLAFSTTLTQFIGTGQIVSTATGVGDSSGGPGSAASLPGSSRLPASITARPTAQVDVTGATIVPWVSVLDVTFTAVPEPDTVLMMMLGLVGLTIAGSQRRSASGIQRKNQALRT